MTTSPHGSTPTRSPRDLLRASLAVIAIASLCGAVVAGPGAWRAPAGAAPAASADEAIVGDVRSDLPVVIVARRITVRGSLQAPAITLRASVELIVEPGARLTAGEHGDGGAITLAAPRAVLGGVISADGGRAGRVTVAGDRLLLHGRISADGTAHAGSVRIDWTGNCQQVAAGSISSCGPVGGRIEVLGGAGRAYLSGAVRATGGAGGGGMIDISGDDLCLVGARLDASGDAGGGSLRVGGPARGLGDSLGHAATTRISGGAELAADALDHGQGGAITIWSEQRTDAQGRLSARGGARTGAGGTIEVSSRGQCGLDGATDVGAAHGAAGSLLLDPRNLVISAVSGTFPSYDLLDPHPAAGNLFGTTLYPLGSGNVLVSSPGDTAGAPEGGAMYLFNGRTGVLISALTGTAINTTLGDGPLQIQVLTNGNYVLSTFSWSNWRGAATWGSGATGRSGVISAANSLVGTADGDRIGLQVQVLSNGNYVVGSPYWTGLTGAATWGDGTTGITGQVSAANSLVGAQTGDGIGDVTPLTNGNYVVASRAWSNNTGAVTWGDGRTGSHGVVGTGNSMVGASAGDFVGQSVTALSNGNYAILSSAWSSSRGAATWGDGRTGTTGVVGPANSVVGSAANDAVAASLTALTNGNYVVAMPFWSGTSGVFDPGAATWCDGATGTSGIIGPAISLVGTASDDTVGRGVTALTNGNYVVTSVEWGGNRGSATWGNGTSGTRGPVGPGNSLVGSGFDQVGTMVTALSNGNYLVSSGAWNGNRGAVSWGNGAVGTAGVVSAANSLVGSTPGDGNSFFIPPVVLANGNYVVVDAAWSNLGAVAWGNGATGTSGVISAVNSLVGTLEGGAVGSVTPLTNGNYVVSSPQWLGVGASTWVDGAHGLSGTIDPANSLVGCAGGAFALNNGNYVIFGLHSANAVGSTSWVDGTIGLTGVVDNTTSDPDGVSDARVEPLSNGDYLVCSASRPNTGGLADAGSVTWVDGRTGWPADGSRLVTVANSIFGGSASATLYPFNIAESVTTHLGFAPFITDTALGGDGRVRVIFADADPNHLAFATAQVQTLTIRPDFLTRTLASGGAVTLQASNDLTVASPIVVIPSAGRGGALTLQAGRSLHLDAGITTGNGDLTLVANDRLAAGVVNAQRSAGAAAIAMAAGTAIDAGSGAVAIDLRDGAGLTNLASGTITLQALTAGTAIVANHGTSANSGIVQNGVWTVAGASAFSAANGTVALAGALTLTPAGISSSASTTTLSGTLAVPLTGAGTLDVTGQVALANATLAASASSTPPVPGTVRTLISNHGAQPVSGTFALLAEGAVVPVNGFGWRLSYGGGDGNDVVLTAVPVALHPTLLTITADDQAMRAGAPLPPLTATYAGFLAGDGPSTLTTLPVLSTTATAASPLGTYPIAVGGATAPYYYQIAYVPGVLTISAPPPGPGSGGSHGCGLGSGFSAFAGMLLVMLRCAAWRRRSAARRAR